ncbi:hypothetical protein KsCSTR_42770 [Candidatus Kuenenia stuttgartiensis]|uniref:Uncharacterized protein n=1 Tax=Kuenenia stuttgartiensis TaxID=174633 RepID=Q1PX95_KUEST|nr:hypothetical protein KsCSTR_42770 [Candidatus Kuenenia stuttgartiensis]CAJ71854.1 unknown protein [Candidatus Kuenenia stuttgartiensis]
MITRILMFKTRFFSPVCVQCKGRLGFCILKFVSYFALRISYFLFRACLALAMPC